MEDSPNNSDLSADTKGAAQDLRKPSRTFSLGTIAALALGAVALVFAIGIWFESRSAVENLTQSFGGKLAELERANRAEATRTEAAMRDLKDAQNRVAQLEVKITEYQNQRAAIDEMTRDLARAPEDWLLAEVEQTLNIASRELTIAGNVRAAIAALQTVDQRLQRAEKLQSLPIRRAITQDLERLKATPTVDTQGISVKLDNLMTLASTLPLNLPDGTPLASESTPQKNTASAAKSADAATNEGWFSRAWRDLKREASELIRIREIESNEVMLLSPQQAFFARENLRLRLLSARTSLIARDETNFKEDVRVARELISKYFDPKAKVNQNTIAMLKQLQENPVSIAAPDIVQSLNAIRAARAARERPAR
jgi:uroporphyrin-III C-methyltransferase